MRFNSFSLLLVLALSAGAHSRVFAASEAAWIPTEQRSPAPQLYFSDLPGARKRLSQLKGKVVVVNFWATWCAPCKGEMPEFVKVHAAYRDRGVEFIGAANEPRTEKAKVNAFIRDMQMQFPVWLEASEDHLKAFGIGPGLPGTVILDAQGRIAARIAGVTDGAQLRELLDRLLSEQPSASARTGGR